MSIVAGLASLLQTAVTAAASSISGRARSLTSPVSASRSCGAFFGLEPLERRELLSAWSGRGDGHSWNDGQNWTDGNVPAIGADITFDGVGAVNVTMNSAPEVKVGKVTISGDSQVTLTFDATNIKLTASGDIDLVETDGKKASLDIETNGTDASPAAVSAQNFIVDGAMVNGSRVLTGTGQLIVGNYTGLYLVHDMISKHNLFNMNIEDHGIANVSSAYLKGKDLPATGDGDVSTITVYGQFIGSGTIRIGGQGLNDCTVGNSQGGLISSSLLMIDVGTHMYDQQSGIVQFHNGYIGNVAAGLEAADTNLIKQTRKTEVHVSAVFRGLLDGDVTASLNIAGGHDMIIDADGGRMTDFSLTIGGAGNSSLGPTVTIEGTNGYLKADPINIVDTGTHGPGHLVVNGNTASVDSFSLWVWSATNSSHPMVLVENGANLNVDNGVSMTGGSAGFSSVKIDGGKINIKAVGAVFGRRLVVGDSFGTDARLDLGPAGGGVFDAAGGGVTGIKYLKSTISGGGSLIPIYTPAPGGVRILNPMAPGADIMPGDYFTGFDSDFNLLVNCDPQYPYGTMTINGDLVDGDSTDGGTLKLDLRLGYNDTTSQWAVSNLAVTGNVTLNGSALYISADDSGGLNVPMGTTLTLLSAASITGRFADLAAGYVNTWYDADSTAISNDLPALDATHKWQYMYASGDGTASLQLRVVEKMVNAQYTIAMGDGNVLAGSIAGPVSGNVAPPPGHLPAELDVDFNLTFSASFYWDGAEYVQAGTMSNGGGQITLNLSTHIATLTMILGDESFVANTYTLNLSATSVPDIFTATGDPTVTTGGTSTTAAYPLGIGDFGNSTILWSQSGDVVLVNTGGTDWELVSMYYGNTWTASGDLPADATGWTPTTDSPPVSADLTWAANTVHFTADGTHFAEQNLTVAVGDVIYAGDDGMATVQIGTSTSPADVDVSGSGQIWVSWGMDGDTPANGNFMVYGNITLGDGVARLRWDYDTSNVAPVGSVFTVLSSTGTLTGHFAGLVDGGVYSDLNAGLGEGDPSFTGDPAGEGEAWLVHYADHAMTITMVQVAPQHIDVGEFTFATSGTGSDENKSWAVSYTDGVGEFSAVWNSCGWGLFWGAFMSSTIASDAAAASATKLTLDISFGPDSSQPMGSFCAVVSIWDHDDLYNPDALVDTFLFDSSSVGDIVGIYDWVIVGGV